MILHRSWYYWVRRLGKEDLEICARGSDINYPEFDTILIGRQIDTEGQARSIILTGAVLAFENPAVAQSTYSQGPRRVPDCQSRPLQMRCLVSKKLTVRIRFHILLIRRPYP